MPMEITGKTNVDVHKKNDCENPIFESRQEMNKSLTRFCYGNLHIIGSLWVEALKSVLVGKKMCIIPTVEAATPKKDEKPKKPPLMKYKELPLYERPHWEYKQHVEDEVYKCLGKNPKLIQSMVHPTVVWWRKGFTSTACGLSCFFSECMCELGQDLSHQIKCFKCCMRSKENFNMRAAVVAASTMAGFIYGRRQSKLLTVRLFWTAVGALGSGALCFPKETDENVRLVGHQLNRVLLAFYSLWAGGLKEKATLGPCEKEMPPIPPKRQVDKKYVCVKPKPPPPKKK